MVPHHRPARAQSHLHPAALRHVDGHVEDAVQRAGHVRRQGYRSGHFWRKLISASAISWPRRGGSWAGRDAKAATDDLRALWCWIGIDAGKNADAG